MTDVPGIAPRAPEPFDPDAFDPAAYGPEWSAGRRHGTDAELRQWLDLAVACCDAADPIALRHFRRDLQVDRKADRTLVTQADRRIEEVVRERLLAAHPDHGLIGEEYGPEAADASVRWYIDPIDGTHNYVRGVPLFGTIIGVERDGEIQAGVLSAPAMHQRWVAWRGGGAWSLVRAGDGWSAPRRVHVSDVRDLAEAQVLYSSPFDVMRSGWAPGMQSLMDRIWRDRGFGDYWGYTLVADAAAEGMIDTDMKPWDLSAPQVIVEEAGGRLTDFGGARRIDGATMLASNGHLHGALLAGLAGR